jgi:hypothetical protein
MFVLKPEKKRSAVYRLEGAGPGGSSVVGKRGRTERLATELLIYYEVLPRVPARTLRCYGSIDDDQPGFGWLFLEDAGEERFSSSNPEHRAAAAHWLALLHTSVPSRPAWYVHLPARSVGYYRAILTQARDVLLQGLANPALSRTDAATLEAIRMACDRVEARWRAVEKLCQTLPHTLVHGDFGAKNLRVRRRHAGIELLALDWDSAGWGVAATDLSQAEAGVYSSVASTRWPELDQAVVASLATVGRMFLALESITGERDPLSSGWTENAMRKMRAYQADLDSALQVAGWAA